MVFECVGLDYLNLICRHILFIYQYLKNRGVLLFCKPVLLSCLLLVLVKQLSKTITKLLPLPHCYNVKKLFSSHAELQGVQFDNDLKFVLFDISNIYTNIPTNELTDVIQHHTHT